MQKFSDGVNAPHCCANVVFSVLIKSGKTLDLFILNRAKKRYHFVAPEFLMVEVEKHTSEIIKKTGLSIEEFGKVLDFLEKEIEFVSFEEFEEFYKEAEQISPDPNDVQYFALALKLNGAIWSNDKALKKQFVVEVLSTGEIIKLMEFE
ncbi:MAG: PIN domain-containing protein [Candidatus Methanoperedens sp.]|nr:PIN domain-containing protein [Candidatus Methanoperedens sp.]